MAYSQQIWGDGSGAGTPVSAARLNYMEAGIAAAASPTTHKNTVTGWWHVAGYGSMAGDIGPLVNSAVADCVADGGGVVYIGPGDFTVSTTINLSNIHVNDFDSTTGVSVTLKGAGKH